MCLVIEHLQQKSRAIVLMLMTARLFVAVRFGWDKEPVTAPPRPSRIPSLRVLVHSPAPQKFLFFP